MRAAVYEAYGDPDVVEIREIAKPVPGPGEVLVRVHATSVTSGDARLRAFDIPPLFRLPARFMLGWPKPKNAVLGFEFAGTVEAAGPGVTKFRAGDRVFGAQVNGGHAEYRTIREAGAIALMPDTMSFTDAAALPFGGNTALHFLRKAKLAAGQSILINGGSGCVGSYAVQLARHFGADVTAVTSGTNAEFVTALGAARIIDYTHTDIARLPDRVDIVFDTVGTLTFASAAHLIAPRGTYIAGVMSPADIWPMLWPPARHGRTIIGGEAADTAANMETLAKLAVSGAIRPVIGRTFPFEQIREAYAYVDSRRKRGAAVLTIN